MQNPKIKIISIILIIVFINIVFSKSTNSKSFIMLEDDDCDYCITKACIRTEPPFLGNK